MTMSRNIGLVFDARFAWVRGEVRGAVAYARDHGLRWRFAGGPDTDATWAMMRRWKPDGFIVTGAVPPRWRGPVPFVGALEPEPQGSAVLDNGAIGALAAHHLIERGFLHLAFVGERGQQWAAERGLGFETAWRQGCAGRHGATFGRLDLAVSMTVTRTPSWRPAPSDLVKWLMTLPRPVGVLACRDLRAIEVAQVCRDRGLRVPEDVAIVGVDNDDLLCETVDPPLSSVEVPWERIGYHMGEHLDRLLRGNPEPRSLPKVSPDALIVRRSSDGYAVSDEAVVRACRFIRENTEQTIGVEETARAAAVSRRGLERRFRRELGRSPLDEIRRVKLDLAQRLLRDTPLALAVVAQRTGFATVQRFATVFKAQVGQTPGRYRASLRSLG